MAANGSAAGAIVARATGGDGRLRSWKEIGRWFGVDERTVKRWEESRGLPIHRVPGDARAPVFAYEVELTEWLNSRRAPAVEVPVRAVTVPVRPRRFPVALALAGILLVLVTLLAWQGWRSAAAGRREASERVADVRQLARAQVVSLNGRLENLPGTVRMRAALAQEAATMLARVAAAPDAEPGLRQEAAEAYRRLAAIQNATDRPSLRDRPAARATLGLALRLVDGDRTPAGRWLAARILVDAARQAAADGAVALAPAMLARAADKVRGGPASLQDELLLGAGEIAVWQGDYGRARKLVAKVRSGNQDDRDAVLRRLRGLETGAEARFYADDIAASLAGYRMVEAEAAAALARWPDDPRFRWSLQRQQWNLGTTLVGMDRSAEALDPLRASRDGWLAMARSDPEDEALASWVRTARESYGEALAHAGRTTAAIDELSLSLAGRRAWLAGQPDNAERRRALIVGLVPLGNALATAGRRGEACALYSEAAAMAKRMAASSNLTALDRDSVIKELHDGAARNCPEIDVGRPFA